MRACLTHLYKQIGYAVEMNCRATNFFETGAKIVVAVSLFLFVSAWNCGCVTTTTPVDESGWLTKRDDSAAVQKDVKADGGLKATAVNPGQEKPWDKPIPVEQKSAFVAPAPHCQAMRWVITNGGNIITQMWIVLGTWACGKIFIINNK